MKVVIFKRSTAVAGFGRYNHGEHAGFPDQTAEALVLGEDAVYEAQPPEVEAEAEAEAATVPEPEPEPEVEAAPDKRKHR